MAKHLKQTNSNAPDNLRCEYLENPLGIDTKSPRLGWQFGTNSCSKIQTAYHILVATSREKLMADEGDMWDSGKVFSNQSVNVEYEGKALQSKCKYYWKVRLWDEHDCQSLFSEPACFEMGLLSSEDWHARWIGSPDEGASSPLLRKEILLTKKVHKARAYICGLGYYELYLNGQKVGDHVLDPNWTDFDRREMKDLLYPFDDKTSKTVLYVTYDVTCYLKEAENCIGVMLGNGWYNQRERTVEGKMWYGSPRMLLQMDIVFEDGSSMEIISDETWKTSSGPITFNNIFYGEVYDARLEKTGWNLAGYDDSNWESAVVKRSPEGILKSQLSPADKVMASINPVKMTNPSPDVYIFDMGQNFSGWVKLTAEGPEGTEITLRFSEEINEDGTLDFSSTGGSDQIQKDVYILKGAGVETYEPRFTWHGFRYVEVTGYPGTPKPGSIEGKVVHSAVERVGYFRCSNPLINKIYQNYIWTQLSNMHGGVPSDCPHRERLGYTGDGHVSAEAAIFNFDMSRFYTKWVGDISDAQNKESGFVPHTAPFGGGGGGPAWGCAYVIIPWYMYLYYGDKRILKQHYEGMKHWAKYLEARTEDYIVVKEEFSKDELGGWSFLGEWCIPRSGMELSTTDNLVPPELVSTFFYARVTDILSRVAGILGKHEDKEYFSDTAAKIREAFHRHFFVPKKNTYSIGCKGADVYPLILGCVPEQYRDKVLQNLVENIRIKNKGHLDTGIYGTPLLLEILAEHGYGDLALEMVTSTTYPGYGYMVEKGATTLWEFWEYENGSHNHPMFGSVVAWFFKYIAGIRVDVEHPGFEKVVIKPGVFGDLTFAEASIRTVRGMLHVKWSRGDDGKVSVKVDAPFNCTVEVEEPDNR